MVYKVLQLVRCGAFHTLNESEQGVGIISVMSYTILYPYHTRHVMVVMYTIHTGPTSAAEWSKVLQLVRYSAFHTLNEEQGLGYFLTVSHTHIPTHISV